jgi:hypothetical protein
MQLRTTSVARAECHTRGDSAHAARVVCKKILVLKKNETRKPAREQACYIYALAASAFAAAFSLQICVWMCAGTAS